MNPQSQQSQIYFTDGTNIYPQVNPSSFRIHPIPINPQPVYFDENMVNIPSNQNMGNVMIVQNNHHLPLEVSPDKGTFNDSILKEGQIPQSDPSQPYNQNLTWTEKLKAKKFLLIGIGVGMVVLIIIGIVLGIVLSKIIVDPQDQFSCDQSPAECQGVPEAVNNYIFQNYNDPDQVRSLLQTSRSFSLIPTNSFSNVTRQNLTDIYRNITRSVQCLSSNLPGNFSQQVRKISQLQFTTQEQIIMYLKMAESFSGQPLKLASQSNMAKACRFSLSNSRRRLLQQSSPQVGNSTENCASNATSVLIYFSGIGYSPSATIQSVIKMQEILSTNSSTNFDAGIIALSPWRIDSQLGYFSSILSSYQYYYRGFYASTPPSRYYLYSGLQMILDLCRNTYCRPPEISSDMYIDLWRYYVYKSVQSLQLNSSYYDISRHVQFVLQQINQGKKVVLLAHASGTVYANKVYNLLNSTQKQSVKLVYVAPTVPSMADNSTNYITNPNDTIISKLKQNFYYGSRNLTAPLRANVPASNFDSEVDFGSNHQLPGYAKAYKQELTRLIILAKDSAIQPSTSMGSGPITITLTWDIQKDIDLHIIQPDGAHIYFGNKTGNSGRLDVDDMTRYGPEHYYSKCNLRTGNYTVYIHYYSGLNTSTTITTVSAGSEFFMKTAQIQLYKNVSICTIGVTYDNPSQSYQFTIYPA